MPHDWIFEVLEDLRSFALANDLQALAAQIDMTLKVAEAEVVARGEGFGPSGLPMPEHSRPN